MIAHVGSVPVEEWLVIVGPMAVVIVLYGRGLKTMAGLTQRPLRYLSLIVASTVMAALSTETVEAVVAERFSLHMAQHLMLLVPVPLLFVYARTGRALTWGLPRSWRRATGPFRRMIIRLTRGPGALMVVGVIYLIVLWSWHLPVLYDAAIENPLLHLVEHIAFLCGGLLLWLALTSGSRPAFHRMMLLFATALHSGFLGAVLMLAPVVLYQSTSSASGVDPLADQQLAGVIMWVPMSVVFLVTLLTVFARELRRPQVGSVHLLCALLLVVLSGCGYGSTAAPSQLPVAGTDRGVESGAVLYARECAWCHGARGEGTDRGPNLDGELDGGAYTHFMLSSGRMPIASPAVDAGRRQPRLSPEEIGRLVSFVDGFGGTGPDVPSPDINGVAASEGAESYLNNCAACHSSTGAGGSLTSGEIAPPLTDPSITPINIAEAILVGPGCRNDDPECSRGSGAMPSFAFEEEEVNAIVAYVVHLQEESNPGGWALGRFGPVTEGAAAWLLGLGAMLGVARWIGTREEDSGEH